MQMLLNLDCANKNAKGRLGLLRPILRRFLQMVDVIYTSTIKSPSAVQMSKSIKQTQSVNKVYYNKLTKLPSCMMHWSHTLYEITKSGASKLASTCFTLFYRSVHVLYTEILLFLFKG